MSFQKGRLWLPFLSIAVLLILLSFHFSYPFWFIWDMDHTVVVDTLLIQDGQLPVHLHHPGFGMYLPLVWSQFLAHQVGIVSLLGIGDLLDSVGPLLGIVELTDFFRHVSPLVVLGFIFLLWKSLIDIFELKSWQEIVIFAILSAEAGLFYHSTMIRTELYALFWWAAAIFSFSRSSISRGRFAEVIWLAGGGLFIALGMLSKIQLVLYVAAALFFLAIFRSQKVSSSPGTFNQLSIRRLSWINFIFSIFLMMGANLQRPYGATFTDDFKINFMGVAYLALNIFFLLAVQDRISRSAFWNWQSIRRISNLGTVILVGFHFGFLLHFLMYLNPLTSYRLMLLDSKMIFFRRGLGPSMDLAGILKNSSEIIGRNPLLYLVLVLFFFVFLLKAQSFKARLMVLMAVFLSAVSVFWGSRAILRDLIWAETLVLFLALWMALEIWRLGRGQIRAAVFGGLALIFLGSFGSIHRMKSDLDANYNQYGWKLEHLLSGVYSDGHLQYGSILQQKYGSSNPSVRQAALYQTLHYQRVRQTAAFVMANAFVSMKSLGLADLGQAVFGSELNVRLESLPDSLRLGILVDSRSLVLDSKEFYEKNFVNVPDERLDKRRVDGNSESYSVLPRSDLDVYLIASPNLTLSSDVLGDAGQVNLIDGNQKFELRAYRIRSYAVLPREALGERHFMVIKEKTHN